MATHKNTDDWSFGGVLPFSAGALPHHKHQDPQNTRRDAHCCTLIPDTEVLTQSLQKSYPLLATPSTLLPDLLQCLVCQTATAVSRLLGICLLHHFGGCAFLRPCKATQCLHCTQGQMALMNHAARMSSHLSVSGHGTI